MHRTYTLVLIMIIWGVIVPATGCADVITLVADPWCPYNCTPESDQPGFMIEMAQSAFQQAGHQVEYRQVNWARAIKEVERGDYTGLIATSHANTPDFVFPESEQAVAQYCFFGLPQETWTYQGETSLPAVNIGVINEYAYGDEIDAYLEAHRQTERVQFMAGENALFQNIRKLLADRIDVILQDPNVMHYTRRTAFPDNPPELKEVGCLSSIDLLYIGFSPNNPKSEEYAAILVKGIEELRQSGQLQEILNKYGVDDWR